MIDADGNGKTYVELQVAPNGSVTDTTCPRTEVPGPINPR
jgi:hypothetical protein